MMPRPTLCRLAALGLFAALSGAAAAEPSPGVSSLQMNRDQPVKIESTTLEVRDKSRVATFSGDVKLTQGETVLTCKTLVVFYEDSASAGNKKGGGQQIKRIEAKGSVVVKQKDQTASGDSAVYDPKTNTVTLIGNVVVTQGQNVLRGERMVVNMTTGITRVESTGKDPVSGLLFPNATKDAKETKSGPPAPATPPAKSSGPMRIN